MERHDPEFLPTMAGILRRLQRGSAERGHSMLAAFLDMARDEVEHLLTHEAELADLKAKLEATSARHTWRPSDFPAALEDLAPEEERDEAVAAAAA